MEKIRSNLEGFCAAPWVEGVLYNNGTLRTCCRNVILFSNWQKLGLEKSWNSAAFQEFRKKISKGEFPDEGCRKCYFNGTARSLHSEISGPFELFRSTVSRDEPENMQDISRLTSLFHLKKKDDQTDTVLADYFSALQDMGKPASESSGFRLALHKLNVIGKIVRAFLEGNPKPPIIAPFRQVQLIAKCNARCIHCPGKYSRGIVYAPGLAERHIGEAFCNAPDIIDFFMNGSEFMLYPGWKKIAASLVENGVRLSLSTNGILLHPSNVRCLIDNKIIRNLNVSMDGATRQTVESIRKNVNFERLMRHLDDLFHYADEVRYPFQLSVSFVLMKRNYQEFPQLVRLMHRIRKNRRHPAVNVYCQALENCMYKGYADFVLEEHHSLVDPESLKAVFYDASRASKETGIPVGAFYSHDIDAFIQKGCPFPPMTMHKSNIVRLTEISPSLNPQTEIDPSAADPGLNMLQISGARTSFSEITPSLCVPEEDHGKQALLYALLMYNTKIYMAKTQCNAIEWAAAKGPLERMALCDEMNPFDACILEPEMSFHLPLNGFCLNQKATVLDVYIGYALDRNLSGYKGTAYRIIVQ